MANGADINTVCFKLLTRSDVLPGGWAPAGSSRADVRDAAGGTTATSPAADKDDSAGTPERQPPAAATVAAVSKGLMRHDRGLTPLQYACLAGLDGHPVLRHMMQAGEKAITGFVSKARQQTYLHWAADEGQGLLLELLLERGERGSLATG